MNLPFIGEIGGSAERGKVNATASQTVKGKQIQQRQLSQDAVDRIIQNVLGGDQGLAALASGENISGLSGTSVKTMLASDLVSKLVGEIATVTAPVITTTDQEQQSQSSASSKKAGVKTVICTELERQGKLDTALYLAGMEHFLSLSETTVRGYRVWANKVVPLMQRSERLSNALAPIVNARYQHITGRNRNFLGALTVYIGQPICYFIGLFVPAGEQYGHLEL